jgi:hypothetical protein
MQFSLPEVRDMVCVGPRDCLAIRPLFVEHFTTAEKEHHFTASKISHAVIKQFYAL